MAGQGSGNACRHQGPDAEPEGFKMLTPKAHEAPLAWNEIPVNESIAAKSDSPQSPTMPRTHTEPMHDRRLGIEPSQKEPR